MMTSTLTVVGREVFIDDYNEEIDNDYWLLCCNYGQK